MKHPLGPLFGMLVSEKVVVINWAELFEKPTDLGLAIRMRSDLAINATNLLSST